MANTLTNLIPTMYEALDVVSREMVGFIPAVTRHSGVERAALNQPVLVPVVPATTAEAANTPAVTAPDTGDQSIDTVEIKITKSYHIPVRWNGEETRGLNNAGTYNTINRDRFAQAFRRLTNLIETDLASTYKFASRAYGTAGTTPFASATLQKDFAQPQLILDDNGAPPDDRHMVLSNAAVGSIRGERSELWKANEAGTDELLRNGIIARVQGLNIHQSGQVALHTRGTASGATLDSTDYAIGTKSLTVAAAGSGTLVEGDQVNIAGENNGIWYGVRSGVAEVGSGGTLALNAPGLRIAQTTNTSNVTVPSANWRANMVFHRGAIVLATRPPALPEGGDMAEDMAFITDPRSGIVYEVAVYKQFMQNVIHVRVAWGWQAIKQEHIAVLFG